MDCINHKFNGVAEVATEFIFNGYTIGMDITKYPSTTPCFFIRQDNSDSKTVVIKSYNGKLKFSNGNLIPIDEQYESGDNTVYVYNRTSGNLPATMQFVPTPEVTKVDVFKDDINSVFVYLHNGGSPNTHYYKFDATAQIEVNHAQDVVTTANIIQYYYTDTVFDTKFIRNNHVLEQFSCSGCPNITGNLSDFVNAAATIRVLNGANSQLTGELSTLLDAMSAAGVVSPVELGVSLGGANCYLNGRKIQKSGVIQFDSNGVWSIKEGIF